MRWILLLIVLAILYVLAKVFISGVITGIHLVGILVGIAVVGLIIWLLSKNSKDQY